MQDETRAKHEIEHGKMLAESKAAEAIWGWNSPAGRVRARRRAELIAAGAQLDSGKRVLEIGCGTGMFTEIFASKGANILAVDISPDLLELARKRGLPSDQVNFVETAFEDCGLNSQFDAVIGSSVLHHLDITRALAKIYDLLKPGGYISFAEPNMLNPQIFIERKLSFIRPLFSYVSPDETAFVRSKLKNILVCAGFKDVRIVPFDWLHPAVPSFLIPTISKMGLCVERIPLLKEFSGSLHITAKKPE